MQDQFRETLRVWSVFAAGELGERTIRNYRYYLLRFEADTMVSAFEANLDDLSTWLASLGQHGPARGQGKRALCHFFRWLQLSGRRMDDPSKGLPRTRRVRRGFPDFLTQDEWKVFVRVASNHSQEWAESFRFIYGTATRIGEACAVRPDDVDFERDLLLLSQTKAGVEQAVILGPTAREALTFLIARNGTQTVLGVRPGAIRYRMHQAAAMAGFDPKRLHPHTLRHSAATHLLERGADVRQVMAFLRHTDERMFSLYTHITDKRFRETANLL